MFSQIKIVAAVALAIFVTSCARDEPQNKVPEWPETVRRPERVGPQGEAVLATIDRLKKDLATCQSHLPPSPDEMQREAAKNDRKLAKCVINAQTPNWKKEFEDQVSKSNGVRDALIGARDKFETCDETILLYLEGDDAVFSDQP